MKTKNMSWGARFASNFGIECEDDDWGNWEWMKRPTADIMAQVEKWDFLVRLVTFVKRDNLIETRAYFPPSEETASTNSGREMAELAALNYRPVHKFETTFCCTECRKEVVLPHSLELCQIGDVMES